MLIHCRPCRQGNFSPGFQGLKAKLYSPPSITGSRCQMQVILLRSKNMHAMLYVNGHHARA